LPREFQGSTYDAGLEDDYYSDYDDLGLLGTSMLNFY